MEFILNAVDFSTSQQTTLEVPYELRIPNLSEKQQTDSW